MVNEAEVKNHEWVSRLNIDDFLADRLSEYDEDITPWFGLLRERKLMAWWRDLEEKGRFPA